MVSSRLGPNSGTLTDHGIRTHSLFLVGPMKLPGRRFLTERSAGSQARMDQLGFMGMVGWGQELSDGSLGTTAL